MHCEHSTTCDPPAQVSKKPADKPKFSSEIKYQANTKCHRAPWSPPCDKYLLIVSAYCGVMQHPYNLLTGKRGISKDSKVTPQCSWPRGHVHNIRSFFTGLRRRAQISVWSSLAKGRNWIRRKSPGPCSSVPATQIGKSLCPLTQSFLLIWSAGKTSQTAHWG